MSFVQTICFHLKNARAVSRNIPCKYGPRQANLVLIAYARIRAVSPEPSLLAHTSSESRGTFRQKARSLAPLNGWACAVKICHDGMLEDTNSLDGAHYSHWIQHSQMHNIINGMVTSPLCAKGRLLNRIYAFHVESSVMSRLWMIYWRECSCGMTRMMSFDCLNKHHIKINKDNGPRMVSKIIFSMILRRQREVYWAMSRENLSSEGLRPGKIQTDPSSTTETS